MSKNARRFQPKPAAKPTRKQKVQLELVPTPITRRTVEILAQTDRQADYLDALRSNSLVFCIGCAGTGKTYLAASYACQLYQLGKIKRIVLTRPNVSAGSKSLGYFPGTLEEKMAPWAAPVIDVLKKHLGVQKVAAMVKAEEIVIEPFETMRGKSFENAFVLLDEAQNTTVEELKMFLTRLGKGCRTVVDGDIAQSDLKAQSGLKPVLSMIRNQGLPFPLIEFGPEDIVRSDICAIWIKAFIRMEKAA